VIRIDALWLAVDPVDMHSGPKRHTLKLLVHHGFGLWCAARRLNVSGFVWPRNAGESSIALTLMNPQTAIESKQIHGEMRRLQSLMTLSADAGGTQLAYRLELVPTGLAAGVMSEERLKRDMEEQFTAIVAEMIKRKK
jgi:transposase